jgi:SAM-dependent methyltransferase
LSERAFRAALIDAAAAPYRQAGHFARHFARGKLAGDPAFVGLLRRGLIAPGARVLDLGCGQGLLAATLLAADTLSARGLWPSHWPAAPAAARVRGIELAPIDVERARRAVGAFAVIEQGDIRTTAFGTADVVVILDVLHYFPRDDQDAVLARVHTALGPDGVLLLRVGDAAAGLRFTVSHWVDRVVNVARGHRLVQLHCRPLRDWLASLEQLGFRVEAVPMSQGTPFANVLLVARRAGLQ